MKGKILTLGCGVLLLLAPVVSTTSSWSIGGAEDCKGGGYLYKTSARVHRPLAEHKH